MVCRLLAPAAALLPLLLCVPAAVSAADTVAPAAILPRLKVAQPAVDLGSHFGGPAFWFAFRLRNEGSAPLEIQGVKLSCGCLAAFYDRRVLPGQETVLRVKMATAGLEGTVAKPIEVLTNDPRAPVTLLTARVALRSPIEIVPGRVVHLDRREGAAAVGEIVLRSREAAPLEVRDVEAGVPGLEAKLLPPGKDRHVRRLRVRFAPAEGSPGLASLFIHTNSRRVPRLEIQVASEPRGSIAAQPRRVLFPPLTEKVSAPVARLMMLVGTDDPFTVREARSDSPELTVEVVHQKDAPFAEVTVKYHGGWKPGRREGKLTFLIAGGATPVLEVPYAAEVLAGGGAEPPSRAAPVAAPGTAAAVLPVPP